MATIDSKEEVTVKDIAKLYSRLQNVIETIREPTTRIEGPATSPTRPRSLSPIPTTGIFSNDSPGASVAPTPPFSPYTPKHLTLENPLPDVHIDDNHDCPCRKVIPNKDAQFCHLCSRTIIPLAELHKERIHALEELDLAQQRLSDENRKVAEQTKEIDRLHDRIEELEDHLDAKTDEFLNLQKDMATLNEKYVDEIERVAEIQHSKDMVENELEDLSRKLFEEANGMVSLERKEKYQLEVHQKHLENQLKEMQERLIAEQMQLNELRLRMEQMSSQHSIQTTNADREKLKQVKRGDPAIRAKMDIAALAGLSDAIKESNNSNTINGDAQEDEENVSLIEYDDLTFGEFREFVASGQSMPLKKIHTIPFMKHCLEEDVDACLRFGPNGRVSARKIVDAIVMNTCFIEEAPPGFAEEQANRTIENPVKNSAAKQLLWERFSGNNPTPYKGCQACGRQEIPVPFRFRISVGDDWSCIDRFCRDRIVAVCEFYVFIRNVRMGLYGTRQLDDLFAESLRLRLQMFYTRMGAMPRVLAGLGLKSESLGTASPPTSAPPKRASIASDWNASEVNNGPVSRNESPRSSKITSRPASLEETMK